MALETSTPARTRVTYLPLVASCLGTFLLLLYTTMVTVALPRIGADLHAGFGAVQWIVDAYTLALAGLLLGMGSLSDNLGRKRVYLVGLVVFSAATLLCGLAGSAPVLVLGRALQGVGGAAMFATILPLIAVTYHGRTRATAFAVWGAVAGAAGAVGTLASGLLVEAVGWRWTFLGTVPLCAAALVLAARSLTETERRPSRVDVPGIVTISVLVTALTYAVIEAGPHGWTSPGTLAGLAVTAVATVAFVLAERYGAHPIMPLSLFGTRAFVGVLVAVFGYYFGAFGAMPEISLWLQHETGLSPSHTSLVMVMQLVPFVLVSGLVSGRLHGRPPRLTLGGGTLVVGFGCAAVLAVLVHPSWPWLLPMLALTGIGAGVVSPVFPAVAIAAVPARYAGTAGAAANSARQIGCALGIALSGALYHRYGTPTATTGLLAAVLAAGAVTLVCGTVAWRMLTPRHR